MKRKFICLLLSITILLLSMPLVCIAQRYLPAPTNFNGHAQSCEQIYLKWDKSPGSDKTEIWGTDNPNGSFTLLQTKSGGWFAETDLQASQTRYYKIRALDTDENIQSPFTEVISVTTNGTTQTIPNPPAVLTAVAVSANRVKLMWNAPGSDPYDYYIYRSTSQNGDYQALYDTDRLYYTDSSLTPSTTYWYQVKAKNEAGFGNPTTISITMPSDNQAPPEPPIISSVTVLSSSEMQINWGAVNGAQTYNIYRRIGTKNAQWDKIGNTQNTSYTDNGLSPGTDYDYKVSALNSIGESVMSNLNSGTTNVNDGPIIRPEITSPVNGAVLKKDNFSIQWQCQKNYSEYKVSVYQITGPSTQTQVLSQKVQGNSFVVQGSLINEGINYSIFVGVEGKPTHFEGNSVKVFIKGIPVHLPDDPENLDAEPRNSTVIDLTWDSVTGADKYKLYRSSVSNGKYDCIAEVSQNSYSDNGLLPASTYWYKVTACNNAGESERSNLVGVQTKDNKPEAPAIPKTPAPSEIAPPPSNEVDSPPPFKAVPQIVDNVIKPEPLSVTIDQPDNNASITKGQSVAIYASARGGKNGINGMRIYIDGSPVGERSYTDSVSCTWETKNAELKTYTIKVNAMDNSGKIESAEKKVSIAAPGKPTQPAESAKPAANETGISKLSKLKLYDGRDPVALAKADRLYVSGDTGILYKVDVSGEKVTYNYVPVNWIFPAKGIFFRGDSNHPLVLLQNTPSGYKEYSVYPQELERRLAWCQSGIYEQNVIINGAANAVTTRMIDTQRRDDIQKLAKERSAAYEKAKSDPFVRLYDTETAKKFLARKGDSSSFVEDIQRKLLELPMSSQVTTGFYGDATFNNVAYLQIVNGLDATGYIDQQTYDLIVQKWKEKQNDEKYQQAILDQTFIIETAKLVFTEEEGQDVYQEVITKAVSKVNAYRTAVKKGIVSPEIKQDEQAKFLAQKDSTGQYVRTVQKILRDYAGVHDQQITGNYDAYTWKCMVIFQMVYKERFFPDLQITGNVDEYTNNILYRLSQGEKFKPAKTMTMGEAYREGIDDYFNHRLDQIEPLSFSEFFATYSSLTPDEKKAVWSYVGGALTPGAIEMGAAGVATKPISKALSVGADKVKTTLSECAEFSLQKLQTRSGYWKPFAEPAGKGMLKSVTVKYGDKAVSIYRGGSDFTLKPGEIKIDKATGMVKDTHGVSLDVNPDTVSKFGGAYKIDSLPDGLKIIQRGSRAEHFEIVPTKPMTVDEFQGLLNQIKTSPVK
ncbi:MAG: fibronectin type III domain-containing protein [Deltaproteobacteria bacterium]